MALPVIILLLIVYGYSLLIFLLSLEVEKHEDTRVLSKGKTGVSVVVPFRNEEDNLPALLEDLARQKYPGESMEVLLVDDHSGDASGSIAAAAAEGGTLMRYLQLPAGISGKKKALAYGIGQAGHERIIQVDADCRLGPGFIAAHMAFLEKHPSDLVAGLVTTRREKGDFLEIFDRLEILSLMGTGAGSFSLGRPLMCSGANLSYSRELYLETRPFDPADRVASGDDMFMMIGARKLGRSLSFITSPEAIVHTAPRKTWGTLIVQRVRWSSKAGKLKMTDIQLLALLVVLAKLSILLMPVWILLYPALWPWLAGAWILKSLADFSMLFRMTGIGGSRSDLRMFLPASLVYYPYFLVTLLGALLGKPLWKDSLR